MGPDQLSALVGLVLDIGDWLRSYGSSAHIGVTLGSDHATLSSDRYLVMSETVASL